MSKKINLLKDNWSWTAILNSAMDFFSDINGMQYYLQISVDLMDFSPSGYKDKDR